MTDSVTSNGLSDFIAGLGGRHFRYRRGYKNVINKGIELAKEGVDCQLMMETRCVNTSASAIGRPQTWPCIWLPLHPQPISVKTNNHDSSALSISVLRCFVTPLMRSHPSGSGLRQMSAEVNHSAAFWSSPQRRRCMQPRPAVPGRGF